LIVNWCFIEGGLDCKVLMEPGNNPHFWRFAYCGDAPFYGRVVEGTDGCRNYEPSFLIEVNRPRETQHNEETRE
jgi:hypothetical protein